MNFVLASYVSFPDFNDPGAWLKRIDLYTGILDKLAVNNSVTSVEQIDHEGDHLQNGVNYYFAKFSKLAKYFPFKLHRYIQSQQPDVVIIQSFHFPLQVIQLRLMLGKDVKIIIQNHAEKPFTGLKKYWQLWADRYIDAYLFASAGMGMEWVKKGNLSSPKKTHEVMEVSSTFHQINKELAREKTGIASPLTFLWVGRLEANKDPITVVKGFLKFAAKQADAKLYMIYQTEELLAEVKSLLSNTLFKDAIILIGEVEKDDLLYWYNSADYLISGSHYEGSGTAVCEAMSCGCVPVVTDIDSFRAITDNGNCGLLYKAGDYTALLKALQQTKEIDKQQKRDLCLAYFKDNLSFEAIAKRIEGIVKTL